MTAVCWEGNVKGEIVSLRELALWSILRFTG